jgi:excisionase family DNA binding protein
MVGSKQTGLERGCPGEERQTQSMNLKDRLRVNPAEMAALLGISKRTLSDWMRRRLIPFERIGPNRGRSIVMFDVAAVDTALKRWRVKAVGD